MLALVQILEQVVLQVVELVLDKHRVVVTLVPKDLVDLVRQELLLLQLTVDSKLKVGHHGQLLVQEVI
jgi:hypothetical protein